MDRKVKGVLLALMGVVIWGAVQWPDGRLHVVFCDVGQGDSILMIKGSAQVLVDGGAGEEVLACLGERMPFWDRKIELVVNTHPQKDHLGGLDEVVERYRVGKMVVSSLEGEGEEVKELAEVVEKKGVAVYQARKGDRIRVGEMSFAVLWPEREEGKVLGVSSVNEQSLVLLGSLGEFDWLLTGDIGEETEKLMEKRLRPVEVLKVAHHGSKFSSSEDFLQRVKPELAVIQVGKNSFGHPTREALERLERVGAGVLRNDQQGTIEVVSDGERWWVR